jgi:hypothetical protein
MMNFMNPKWKRIMAVLAGGSLAQFAGQSCRVNVPGNINVDTPPVVVDGDDDDGDDDDGDCVLADCD